MQNETRLIAKIWLGLAGVGVIVVAVLLLAVGATGNPTASILALIYLVAIAVLWVLPLAVIARALLRGSRGGWWALQIHACLGCPFWVYMGALQAPQTGHAFVNRIAHGPHWGGWPGALYALLGILAMLAFSAGTIWMLRRDPPSGWR